MCLLAVLGFMAVRSRWAFLPSTVCVAPPTAEEKPSGDSLPPVWDTEFPSNQQGPGRSSSSVAAVAAAAGNGRGSVVSRAPQKYLIQNQSGMKVYYWTDAKVGPAPAAAVRVLWEGLACASTLACKGAPSVAPGVARAQSRLAATSP